MSLKRSRVEWLKDESLIGICCSTITNLINSKQVSNITQLDCIPRHCLDIILKGLTGHALLLLENSGQLDSLHLDMEPLWKYIYNKNIPSKKDIMRDSIYYSTAFTGKEKYFTAWINYWFNNNYNSSENFDSSGLVYVRALKLLGMNWANLSNQEWSNELVNLNLISAIHLYDGCCNAFIQFLEKQTKVTSIEILFPTLKDTGMIHLFKTIQSITNHVDNTGLYSLIIRAAKMPNTVIAELITLLSNCNNSLNVLKIESSENVNDTSLSSLLSYIGNLNLQKLSVTDCQMGIRSIKNYTYVINKRPINDFRPIHIDFASCKISSNCVESICGLLKKGYPIIELNLSKNVIGDNGALLIADALMNIKCKLEILRIANCSIKSSGGNSIISTLSTNNCLKVLDLSENLLNDDHSQDLGRLCGETLKSNNTLKSLNLSHTLLYSIPDILKDTLSNHTSLIDLSLRGNRLKSTGISDIIDILRNNIILSSLDLAGNLLTSEDGFKIASILTERKKITKTLFTKLDIRLNNFKENKDNLFTTLNLLVDKLIYHASEGSLICDGVQEF